MGLLVWTVLVVLVSSVTRLSAVDVNWLTEVVQDIRNVYKIRGQFSLAANIPLTRNNDRLQEILRLNSYDAVSNALNRNEVYQGDSIIIAKPDANDNRVHAEHRVLTNLQHLTPNSQGNFLLIYTFLSPCRQCAGQQEDVSIRNLISNNVGTWSDSAFVFTNTYNPKNNRNYLQIALTNIGRSMGDLSRVFRCNRQTNAFQCNSCSNNGVVSEVCLDAPGQGGTTRPRGNGGRGNGSNRGTGGRGNGSNRGTGGRGNGSNQGTGGRGNGSNRGTGGRGNGSNRGTGGRGNGSNRGFRGRGNTRPGVSIKV